MQRLASRARRWPLALTVVFAALTALTALAAGSDEPMTHRKLPPLTASAGVTDTLTRTVVVTNTSGGFQVGSLHWAADQIRSLGGTINFDPALGGKTITLESGLYLPHDTYIVGTPQGITISGNGQFRLITSRALVDLQNVTLTNGSADYGSAVHAPRVTLTYSTVKDNRGGPAIFAEKSLHMYNSTVTGNTVAQPAIFWLNGAHVEIEQSTVAFNGPAAGIGMFNSPNPWANVTLRNAIITNNGTPRQNCHNTIGFTYEGANISNDWSCGEVGITVADPKLLPLANNGGPTMTHAIPPASPAYNKGIACHWGDDQRHVKRDAKCDIGAFESGPSPYLLKTHSIVPRSSASPIIRRVRPESVALISSPSESVSVTLAPDRVQVPLISLVTVFDCPTAVWRNESDIVNALGARSVTEPAVISYFPVSSWRTTTGSGRAPMVCSA